MDIRKISIGTDFKASMHYIIGQEVLNGNYVIHLIKFNSKNSSYKLYIEESTGDVVVLWKEFNSNLPITIEYNINF
tara:strand:- start:1418 stop:1645 length:228 start_codon:yes stop_codon:yes gene_type:complete